ncbi:MAG TPA: L,D-transpeptidase family protein [Gemmatimonadaceae bacterium]
MRHSSTRGAIRGVIIAGITLLSACGKVGLPHKHRKITHNWKPAQVETVAGVPAAAIDSAIGQRLAAPRPKEVPANRWEHVQRLYKAYDGKALWMESEGPNRPRTNALLQAVASADSDALRLDAYPLTELVQTIGEVRQSKTPTAQQLANADVLLTTAYIALSEDLLSGQTNPRDLAQDWHIDGGREQLDSAVALSLRSDSLDQGIALMRPQDEDYAALQKEMARFREIVNKGGWPTVPAGKALKRGDKDSPERLAALRGRLVAEGFGADSSGAAPADSAKPNIYDRALAGAVAEFQAHHGIVVDSMLGDETLQSLNVPADYRLAQIAANLERFRWLPRNLGQRYIFVNVPAFRLQAYDSGQKVLEMKVIVGQEYEGKKTPVFADSMETVVFRPYWNVTPDIQRKEIAPKVAANPGYLEANNMEYYRDGGVRRIRQRPGAKNSLGLVKFLFPNDFNIYLHDTPNHELFDKDVRAFSHGCIRVEKPDELAQYVLGWPLEKVQEYEQGQDNRSVRLPKKLPVYITYFTTYTRDGQLYFGNDLYGRDDKLVQQIASDSVANADAARSLEALRRLVND